MNRKLTRAAVLVLLAAAAALVLAACGSGEGHVTTGTYAGESGKNAPYLNVGPLVYEVQLSRALNPYNSEDAGYLEGLTPVQRLLKPGEEWFAVFLQVRNPTPVPHTATTRISIYDTQNNVYQPLVPPGTNHYAYRGGSVPANSLIPEPGTAAAVAPTSGLVLLFKIKDESLNNRPLILKIIGQFDSSHVAEATLDV